MLLPYPSASALGPGTVTVTPDPGLLEADPDLMRLAATQLAQSAKQVDADGRVATNASSELLATWKGKGAQNFRYGAAQSCAQAVVAAAGGLIGASQALSYLADQIEDAQTAARQALALADTTSADSASLERAYEASSATAIEALPPDATVNDIYAARAPTAAQQSQADQLQADATRATNLMTQANEQARQAWQQAAGTLDAITAESPSVEDAVVAANVKVFSQNMDSQATLAIMMAMAGAFEGDAGGDDEDEGDEDIAPRLTPDEVELEQTEISAIDKTEVDGTKLDPLVAADAEAYPAFAQGETNLQQSELDPSFQVADNFTPPPITVNRHGQMTNGRYTLDEPGMTPHKTGSTTSGKSQWLYGVDAETATLNAAAYADAHNLWNANGAAKVPVVNGPVGVSAKTGEQVSWINVYRNRNGFVHASPGNPPS